MQHVISALSDTLGQENVSTDLSDRILFAQDVFTKTHPALAIVRPQTTEQLAATIKQAHKAGLDVVARGGGMSYTSGYVPKNEDSIVVDMRALNRILEINKDDMYVTVEAGCSWESLYFALKEHKLRTPFWGTLSGRVATVGGAMSQNSMFWGSGKYGMSAESILSISVVTSEGKIIKTGSAGRNGASPWFRNFGPDLTGLFLGDCGALGFKATITLKLIPIEEANVGLSFACDDAQTMLAFSSEVSRQGLASEICGFDPFLQAQRLKRESMSKDVQALAGVMKSAGGIGKALKAGAKVALAGRGYMKDVKYSVHVLVQEAYESTASEKAKRIQTLAKEFEMREIENSIPTIMRANPFGPVNTMIGPEAERWVPVHAVMPHSQAKSVYEAIERLFDDNRETLDRFNIGCGYLFSTIGHGTTLIEPVFFWPDELNELHRFAVEDSLLNKLKEFESNPEARAAVTKIRSDLCALFQDMGCIHFQIGKSYPYLDSLKPESAELIKAIKNHVDPEGKINTGVLGL